MSTNPNSTSRDTSAKSQPKVAFAALRHKDFRAYFVATMLAMMADNIEHVISYWLLYEKFRSPVLAGFAVLSHWTPFLLAAAARQHRDDQRDPLVCRHRRVRALD